MSRRIGIDHRTDIYSLGVTLYEMLTLSLPFEGKTSHEVLKKIIINEPRDPRKINDRVPRDLSVICLKAMEKDPGRRYQKVSELGEDLRRFLSGDVILAKPAGPWIRLWKRIKRNPALSAAIGAAATAVVVLGTFLVFLSIEHTAELAKKVDELQKTTAELAKQRNRAVDAQEQAIEQRDEKEKLLKLTEGLRLAAESAAALPSDPALAVLLAIEGLKLNPGKTPRKALLDAMKSCYQIRVLGHEDTVNCAFFSPDNKKIVTASADNTASIWDAGTGQEIALLDKHEGDVEKALFNRDGSRVLTVSKGTVRIWDTETGGMISEIDCHGGTGYLETVDLSPGGRRFATTSKYKTARIWDIITRKPIKLIGHEASVKSALFSHDGKRVVTASRDGTARVWEVETGKQLFVLEGHEAGVLKACFSTDDKKVLTASEDGTARIWNAETGKEIPPLKRIIDKQTGKETLAEYSKESVEIPFIRHKKRIIFAEFSPDSEKVVTASEDNTTRIWDAVSRKEIAPLKIGRPMDSDSDPYIFEEQKILLGKDPHEIPGFHKLFPRIWDLSAGEKVVGIKEYRTTFNSVCFSPDGTRIITADADNTARIWDAETGEEILTLKGHGEKVSNKDMPFQDDRDGVISADFSPDGLFVATASKDGTARIWHALPGKKLEGDQGSHDELVMLRGFEAAVYSGSRSDIDKKVLVAKADGTAATGKADLLSLATRHKPRDLTLPDKKRYDIWTATELETIALVDRLFDELLLSKEVISHLEQDNTLSEHARKTALFLARSRSNDQYSLEKACRETVLLAGAEKEAYGLALRRAEAAFRHRLDKVNYSYNYPHRNIDFRKTLGMAQYRTCMYEEALASLLPEKEQAKTRDKPLIEPPKKIKDAFDALFSSPKSTPKEDKPMLPDAIAFIAMAQFKLGHSEEAKTFLGQLAELMTDEKHVKNRDYQALLNEARNLISSSGTDQ